MVEAEHDAVGVEVGGGVVAEELGVAEDEAGAVVVVGVPGDEGKDGEEERGDPGEVDAELLGCLRSRRSRTSSQSARATGVTMAVSLERAAREKRMAVDSSRFARGANVERSDVVARGVDGFEVEGEAPRG